MTGKKNTNQYFTAKINLLKQFLRISEDFLSSIEDWERYEDHLTKRETILTQLQALEKTHREEIASCSDAQRQEMDQMTDLLLAVDRDIIDTLTKNRLQTLESISKAVTEKKIVGYGETAPSDDSGRLLNRNL